jgi:hypothetical protein
MQHGLHVIVIFIVQWKILSDQSSHKEVVEIMCWKSIGINRGKRKVSQKPRKHSGFFFFYVKKVVIRRQKVETNLDFMKCKNFNKV